MTAKRNADPIKRLTLADGAVRYRVVADTGTHGDGRRRQTTKTFDTRKEAAAWLGRVRTEVTDGAYVAKDRRTVNQMLDVWLEGKRKIRPATRRCYEASLDHARGVLGPMPVQDVSRVHVERLVTKLLADDLPSGRKRSPRTVRLMLGLLRAAFGFGIKQGWCRTNPVEDVETPSGATVEMKCWTREQRAAFLAHSSTDQLAAAWLLTALGMRRGEVLGLRWEDVQLDGDDPHVVIRRSRGVVRREVIEGPPKSKRSRRTLRLKNMPGEVAALKRALTAQKAQRLAAGTAYHSCDGGGHVVADALGRPVHPENYSRLFGLACTAAEVPVIRLHDARHTSVTLMLRAGVPLYLVAAWHGHDPNVAQSVYAHAMPDDLADAGAALALAL